MSSFFGDTIFTKCLFIETTNYIVGYPTWVGRPHKSLLVDDKKNSVPSTENCTPLNGRDNYILLCMYLYVHSQCNL